MDSETGTHTLCEPAQSKCKYRHVTGAIVCGNLHEKIRFLDGVRDRDPHFVRACAVDMHTDMSQEPCGIYRENAARQSEHLDQAPASIPTRRTHQCGHTFPGKNSSGSSVIRTWNSSTKSVTIQKHLEGSRNGKSMAPSSIRFKKHH